MKNALPLALAIVACGVLAGIMWGTFRPERATSIDIGAPDEDFVGAIFPDDFGALLNATALEGKTVNFGGTIQLYRGKPEIALRSASQIRIE